MGMYTELCLNAELRRDPPPYVLAMLRWLTNPDGDPPTAPVEDKALATLMGCERWDDMMVMDSTSFPHATTAAVFYDEDCDAWFLNVHSNIKNYDDEIGKFLAWVLPLVDERCDFLGYWRYEDHEEPTLIYRDEANRDVR